MSINWQPIETAPKDPDDPIEILLCAERDDEHNSALFVVGYWVNWTGDRGGWFNGDITYDFDHFTHWAELVGPSGGRSVFRGKA